MAKFSLFLPKMVVRLRRDPVPKADWGYRWHLVHRYPNGKTYMRDKGTLKHSGDTVCGLRLRTSSYKLEAARLDSVSANDLCNKCFGGLILSKKDDGFQQMELPL